MTIYVGTLPKETKVLIDSDKTSYKLERLTAQTCTVTKNDCIPYYLKAIKNDTELDGIRKAHVRDGVAMVKWLYWLEGQRGVAGPYRDYTRGQVEEFRSGGEHFRGLSFGTIAGYATNSAVGHYKAQPESTPTIQWTGILLVDSGGQYLDGTTDITRTITLGEPNEEQKHAFTNVLRGLIRLSRAKFPKGTKGSQLDMLAREILWQHGWNCRHGIGHGVGYFLNVHEGPQRFNESNTVVFEPGMVNSNEPGVYFEGKFGIRIENEVITVAGGMTDFGEFYRS